VHYLAGKVGETKLDGDSVGETFEKFHGNITLVISAEEGIQ
jgi:hypothetical protein